MRFLTSHKDRVALRWKSLILAAPLFLLLTVRLGAAEYQGKNVDGPYYFTFARSLTTGKFYSAKVVFHRDYASVRLESGKIVSLILDDQSVEDPEEVLAKDPDGRWWALSVDGLDEVVDPSEALMAAETAP